MARNNKGFNYRGTIGKEKDITFKDVGIVDYSGNFGTSSFSAKFADITPSSGVDRTPSDYSPSIYMPSQQGKSGGSLRGVSSMTPMLDAAFSPAILKNSGDYSMAKPSESISITKEIYCVDDIIEVGKIYEGNGYAVSEEYFGNPLHIHNRLFFDVIQCDEMIFAGIASEDIRNDIMSRFGNGMRLWHGDENDPTKLVCENYFVQFGRLFLKDNTEV